MRTSKLTLVRSLLLGYAIAVFTTGAAAPRQPGGVAGVYVSVSESPIMQFNKDGTKKEIGTARTTYTIELNRDATLRTCLTSTYGTGSKTYGLGVWQLKGRRLYFVHEAVLPPNADSDTRSLGAMRVSTTSQGIAFSDIAGFALGSPHMIRTKSADLGAPVAISELGELKAVLDRLVGPVPRPAYAGVESEAALTKIVHDAVATRDVEALMRVTYPLLAGIEPDPQFNTYIGYMNCIAFSGVPKVEEESAVDAMKHLAQMKRGCGCTLPNSVVPRGMFLIGRRAPDGRTGSMTGFFYGIVAGKWAILGNPYNPQKAEQMRRQLRSDKS